MMWLEVGLSVGGSFDYNYRTINYEAFQFDRQWNGDVFDVNRSNSENFTEESMNYLGYGLGAAVRLHNPRYRSYMNVGISGHFKSSAFGRGLLNNGASTAVGDRIVMVMSSAVEIPNTPIDIMINQLFQAQMPYLEYVIQAGPLYHVSLEKGKELALGVTGGYRLGDAIISALHVQYQGWHASLSYDINTSAFSAATNGQGGVELSVVRIITKPKPPRTFKVCPVF